MSDLRTRIINQIMHMKTLDETYARWSLAQYHAAMPWLDLNAGISAAMKGKK